MYDFDTPARRRGTDCFKWDGMERPFGRADLVPLWVADSDFLPLPEIAAAIRERAGEGQAFGYTAPGEGYLESILRWNEARNGLALKKDDLLPVPGVVTGLVTALLALTKEGDGVLINPPVYTPFYGVVRGLGRTLVESPLVCGGVGDWQLDFADLEEKMRGGTVTAYLLCSPHNPVGRVWTPDELSRLAALCRQYGVQLISDEIHGDILLGGAKFTPILAVEPQAVAVAAPSKTFNIAGLKCSHFMIPDEGLRKKVAEQLHVLHLECDLLAYRAAEAAYTHGARYTDECNAYMTENARFAVSFFRERLPKVKAFVPEGTYLLWLDFSAYGLSAGELRRRLVEEAGVALNAGTDYGAAYGAYSRLNAATPRAILAEGLEKIAKAFGD